MKGGGEGGRGGVREDWGGRGDGDRHRKALSAWHRSHARLYMSGKDADALGLKRSVWVFFLSFFQRRQCGDAQRF